MFEPSYDQGALKTRGRVIEAGTIWQSSRLRDRDISGRRRLVRVARVQEGVSPDDNYMIHLEPLREVGMRRSARRKAFLNKYTPVDW